MLSRLRHLDAYAKPLEDFRVKTSGGAAVTLVSAVIILLLFVSELQFYMSKEVYPELFVDTTRGEKLRINMDVTFPHMACAFLSIDSMDVSGEQQIDVSHNVYKQRLSPDGQPVAQGAEKHEVGSKLEEVPPPPVETGELDPDRCESCYGAETPAMLCCNSCDDVREAYRLKGWAFKNPDSIEQCRREGFTDKMKEQAGEGCRIYGFLEVNKVAGNFHFAPGKSFQQAHVHVHDLQTFGSEKFNLTHHIKHLSFGQEYPGIINPLDGTNAAAVEGSMMFQYFVKIVPTVYVRVNGEVVRTNQFSVTQHVKAIGSGSVESGLPGVFVQYELSPMMVRLTEKHRSFLHFLTGVCAIVGGVFTVAGLIDSFIYHSTRAIQQKMELGKAS